MINQQQWRTLPVQFNEDVPLLQVAMFFGGGVILSYGNVLVLRDIICYVLSVYHDFMMIPWVALGRQVHWV